MSNERRELMQLIDDYRDMHGQPAEASVARAVGIAPQTLNSWRKRGIRQLPEKETLERLASFLGVSYEETVLKAALYDAGWSDDLPYLRRLPGEEAIRVTREVPPPMRRPSTRRLRTRGRGRPSFCSTFGPCVPPISPP